MSLVKDFNKLHRYWMVSPNVKNDEDTVEEWNKASVRYRVVFMGYEPDDPKHLSGLKFAGTQKPHIPGIMPDDRILIARRYRGKPQVVACGVVKGKYQTALKGFISPGNESFGSLRNLEPFKRCTVPPTFLFDVLPRNRALTGLYPDEGGAHKKVCEWIDRTLGINGLKAWKKAAVMNKSKDRGNIRLSQLRENPQLDYKFRTKMRIIKAKASEDKLLREYQDWLKKQNRELIEANYGLLRCDGYEKKHQNLIEAKSSNSREHIRMAVGQLLDYAFQGKNELGDSNMAILLPERPEPDIENWLQYLRISVVWRKGNKFLDNANGRFS